MHRVPGGFPALILVAALGGGCGGTIEGEGMPDDDPGRAPGPGGVDQPAPGMASGGGAAVDRPARTPLRRLTRVQYDNTIRDLLGITGNPGAPLGLDEEDGGFASNAKAPLKELQIERYQQIAEDLAARAVTNLAKLAPCAPPAGAEAACADDFIRRFGKRAYRRPLTPEEATRYK